MKKLAIATVIAATGLLTLRAQPFPRGNGSTLPPGYTSVHAFLFFLEQGNTNTDTNTDVTNFHLKQVNASDDFLLGLVNTEYGTSFSTTNGDQLVVSNIWQGTFSVLGKDGSVLLANASANTNGDSYHLYFHSSRPVYAGTQKTNNASSFAITDTHLYYSSGDGTNKLHLEGFTTVDDEYFHDYTNSTESFQLSGGIGSFSFPDDGRHAVITGNIYGSGRDNAPSQ